MRGVPSGAPRFFLDRHRDTAPGNSAVIQTCVLDAEGEIVATRTPVSSRTRPRGIPLNLNLQTINTVTREVPADLETVTWDDPLMISRFKAMLDYLFAQIPDLQISELAIGNEDYLSVTYYPLQSDFTVRDPSEVGGDFDLLVALYPGKPIAFQECGYPSAAACNSSEQKQSDFVRAVFAAWDRHATRINHISFFLLSDWSSKTVPG